MPESSPRAGASAVDVAGTHVAGTDVAGADQASTGELISRASAQLSELVSSEMELARTELQQTLKHALTGVGLFGTAGIAAFYGGGVLIATLVLALAVVLDAWLAALIVTVVLFVAAGIAALVGKKAVAKAPEPVKRSATNVKRDVAAVKKGAQR